MKAEEHPITANPDVFEYEWDKDCDFIIMGCDGVWERKSNEEMVSWVYEKLGDEPSEADLNAVVKKLLHENISEDHTMTSKSVGLVNTYRRPGLRQHDLYFDCF